MLTSEDDIVMNDIFDTLHNSREEQDTMVFYPPSWAPPLALEPPDSIPLAEFMSSPQYGRHDIKTSRNPFTCGITGRTYSTQQLFERTKHLARSFAEHLGWQPNSETSWDKVLCIFSLNTIDYMTIAYAAHRLNGIVTPANVVYSDKELEHQLRSSGAKGLVTCLPLLEVALRAAKGAGINDDKVFLVDVATPSSTKSRLRTIEDMILEGKHLHELDALKWTKGQGARQPAFLCYSSGTSGLPKAVMISHHNMIANAIQHVAFDTVGRKAKGITTQVVLAPLPMSHIFALMIGAVTCTYRGDCFVVLPKYDFEHFLNAVQRFRAEQILIVPPIIVQILSSPEVCKKYDLSSIRILWSGAAPLGDETVRDIMTRYPSWTVGQGYGMTETSVAITAPSEHDLLPKSAGQLLPGFKVKLMDPQGKEITSYDTPGEVLAQSPSVTLGYMNNVRATAETFIHDEQGRWIRTGDEGMIIKGPSGHEYVMIVDRIKELIKVKGHQVAPAELEAHLLSHPAVSDCAVIQVPDARAGEVPKAYVVKAKGETKSDSELTEIISQWVTDHKASYKALKGGIEFTPAIPKSPSGKILRRLLRDAEKEARRKQGSKL